VRIVAIAYACLFLVPLKAFLLASLLTLLIQFTNHSLGFVVSCANDYFHVVCRSTKILCSCRTSYAHHESSPAGFRNLEYDIPDNQAVHQQRIFDLGDTLNIYVDVTFGLDMRNRRAIWMFQAIDPATGSPPFNISTGVLPPNPVDSTDGQGYVTFSVRALASTPAGTRVHAEATIVFDEEAPIVTPKIFNTIDRAPNTSVVVVDTAVASARRRSRRDASSADITGQILLTVTVSQSGSDVKAIDIFARDAQDPLAEWELVGTATVESPYVLFSGKPGVTYEFASIAKSASGAQEHADGSILDAAVTVVSFNESTCLSNCTDRGVCYLGECICNVGFGGDACESTVVVIEPPTLQVVPITSVMVGSTVPLQIAASLTAGQNWTLAIEVESLSSVTLRAHGVVLNATDTALWDVPTSALSDLTATFATPSTGVVVVVRAHALNGTTPLATTQRLMSVIVVTPSPTAAPSATPTSPTTPPTSPTAWPTADPTGAPTAAPPTAPTALPTLGPSASPTTAPAASPTGAPVAYPTRTPTEHPTRAPTEHPTRAPTEHPTSTVSPTAAPSVAPSTTDGSVVTRDTDTTQTIDGKTIAAIAAAVGVVLLIVIIVLFRRSRGFAVEEEDFDDVQGAPTDTTQYVSHSQFPYLSARARACTNRYSQHLPHCFVSIVLCLRT
jgi:hypothetical protein